MRLRTSPVAWREASRLLRRQRRPLMLALLFVAANRLAALALPAASRYVVDEVIGHQRSDRLGLITLLVSAALAIETAAAFGAMQAAGAAGQRAIGGLRQELQVRVVGLPLYRLDMASSGAFAVRVMTDTDQVRFLVGNGLVQLVASMLTATLAMGLLFWLNAPLTLAVLAILGLVTLAVRRGFRRITTALERVIRRQTDLTAWLGQVVGGARVVKAYAAERHEAQRFMRESHQLVRESLHALRGISLLNANSTLAAGSLGGLLLVIGGGAVAAGEMSLGTYVMYVWLMGLLLAPVVHIAGSAGELSKAGAALGRIAELRALATEAEEDRSRRLLQGVLGAVDFEDVSYAYVPERFALRALSLHAPTGSTTALVGPNGSGKSTLCRLLLAYDRPASGRILIDGHDLATLQRRGYRSRLGVVLQDDVLFDGTIGDNIRYGRPRAPLTDVEAAARLAHCDEFVSRLPDGYSTLVGDRGMRLSAGQRQRVAIARAFLVDPRILILDEATSSLDGESERLIQEALRFLCRGRTTFVIAHRLSTVRSADLILVLNEGAIVERGTHQDLVAQRGRYFRLCEAQAHTASDRMVASAEPEPLPLPVRHVELNGDTAGENGRAH